MRIRAEQKNDRAAVYQINAAAFETRAEAELVETLRACVQPLISLVAGVDAAVVGHIMFSPVSASADSGLRLMGLAPMAVAPAHQRQGIGSALVRAGLERCKALAISAVVVLGHPEYYHVLVFYRPPGSGFVVNTMFLTRHFWPWNWNPDPLNGVLTTAGATW